MSEWFEWREAPESEFGVIGDPIAHSWSPKMMAAAFSELGAPYRYIAIRVPANEFEEAMERRSSLGTIGLNVTIPLKGLAFEWAITPDQYSQHYRSVNTLRLGDRSATNTDASGFLETLADLSIEPGSDVLLLGAGGSASALALALCDAGYNVRVWNRTGAKADELVGRLGNRGSSVTEPDPLGCSLIVNATASTLSGFDLPIDWVRAEPSALAYDLAYGHTLSPFLVAARAAGLRTSDGRAMLVAQGARSIEWWLGVEAPRTAMAEALE